jgi:hypothetical protein
MPSVAFDGTGFIVVWGHFSQNHDIHGARVSSDGGVSHRGAIFSAPGDQVFASVACGGGNCLVAWRDTRPEGPGPDVFGVRVSPAGVVLDPNGIPISTAPGIQGEPDVTFFAGNYLVVWLDDRLDPPGGWTEFSIFGARVSPTGSLLDGPPDTGGIAINTANTQTLFKADPRAGFDGVDYLVLWQVDGYSPPAGVYAARVSPEGSLIDGPAESTGIDLAKPHCFACKYVYPDLVTGGSRVLVAWLNNKEVLGETKQIRGVFACRVDLSGEKVGFQSRCTSFDRRRPPPSCNVRVLMELKNTGFHELEAAWIELFLSEDRSLDSADLLLKRHRTSDIGARSSVSIPLGAQVPSGTGAPGKYVLAAIGPDPPEVDCSAADNVMVLGRIRPVARPR